VYPLHAEFLTHSVLNPIHQASVQSYLFRGKLNWATLAIAAEDAAQAVLRIHDHATVGIHDHWTSQYVIAPGHTCRGYAAQQLYFIWCYEPIYNLPTTTRWFARW